MHLTCRTCFIEILTWMYRDSGKTILNSDVYLTHFLLIKMPSVRWGNTAMNCQNNKKVIMGITWMLKCRLTWGSSVPSATFTSLASPFFFGCKYQEIVFFFHMCMFFFLRKIHSAQKILKRETRALIVCYKHTLAWNDL